MYKMTVGFVIKVIALLVSGGCAKTKRNGVSSESIENILYYQDCNHKQHPTAPPLTKSTPQQECRMCCSMCCGDQCVDSRNQATSGRQAGNQIEPIGAMPVEPVMRPRERRKKLSLPLAVQPLPGRRGLAPLAFTRENIKSLISQDNDIKKILKDLVRVTMQKVDLVQMMNNTPPNVAEMKPEPDADVNNSENDL